MPFPRAWDDIVKVIGFPYRVGSYRMCYNCQTGRPAEKFNVCTGLCPKCVKINADSVKPVVIRHNTNEDGTKCVQCKVIIPNNNFGIFWNKCRTCISSRAMIERCVDCDAYKKSCWNNTCRGCRYGFYLCEKTGYYFSDENYHRRQCWCLTHEEASERMENRSALRYNCYITVPETSRN